MQYFDMICIPAYICLWLFAGPGHINFHNGIFFFLMEGKPKFLISTCKKINTWEKVQNDWKMILTNHYIFLFSLNK